MAALITLLALGPAPLFGEVADYGRLSWDQVSKRWDSIRKDRTRSQHVRS